jgi:hypothetical protein
MKSDDLAALAERTRHDDAASETPTSSGPQTMESAGVDERQSAPPRALQGTDQWFAVGDEIVIIGDERPDVDTPVLTPPTGTSMLRRVSALGGVAAVVVALAIAFVHHRAHRASEAPLAAPNAATTVHPDERAAHDSSTTALPVAASSGDGAGRDDEGCSCGRNRQRASSTAPHSDEAALIEARDGPSVIGQRFPKLF